MLNKINAVLKRCICFIVALSFTTLNVLASNSQASIQKLGYDALRYNVSARCNVYTADRYLSDSLNPVNLTYNTNNTYTAETYHSGIIPFYTDATISNSSFALATSFLNTAAADNVFVWQPNNALVGINQFLLTLEIPCLGGKDSIYRLTFDQSNTLSPDHAQMRIANIGNKDYSWTVGNYDTDYITKSSIDVSFTANEDGSPLRLQISFYNPTASNAAFSSFSSSPFTWTLSNLTITEQTSDGGMIIYAASENVDKGFLEDMFNNMTSGLSNIVDAVSGGLDKVTSGLTGVLDAIINLPQKIFDGLTALFIPDNLQGLLSAKVNAVLDSLGILGYPLVLAKNFVASLFYDGSIPKITFPEFSLTGIGKLWDSYTFDFATIDAAIPLDRVRLVTMTVAFGLVVAKAVNTFNRIFVDK